ncbi:hypothetical protein AHAS_Ahas15G0237700 [Arachis hypogaea]
MKILISFGDYYLRQSFLQERKKYPSYFGQSNFMRNFPPPQNDSRYYAHEPQNGPQFDEIDHYSSYGWKDQNQRDFTHSYAIHQEPSPLNYPTSPPSFTCPNFSSLEYASAQDSFPNPYNSFHHSQNSFHYTQNSLHSPQKSFHYPQESYHSQNTQPQNN